MHQVATHNIRKMNDVIHFMDTNYKDGACMVFMLRQIGPSLTRITGKIDVAYKESWANLDRYCR